MWLHLRMMVEIMQAISSLLFHFYIYYHHLLSNFVPTHISFINWSDTPAACLLIVMFNQVKSWCWRCCDLIHLDYNRQMDMETPGTMGINIITILLLLENVLWIEVMVMQEDVCWNKHWMHFLSMEDQSPRLSRPSQLIIKLLLC